MENAQAGEPCPRCGAHKLYLWEQLGEGEREVARCLPLSADFSMAERAARHLWCKRCWHEETREAPRHA